MAAFIAREGYYALPSCATCWVFAGKNFSWMLAWQPSSNLLQTTLTILQCSQNRSNQIKTCTFWQFDHLRLNGFRIPSCFPRHSQKRAAVEAWQGSRLVWWVQDMSILTALIWALWALHCWFTGIYSVCCREHLVYVPRCSLDVPRCS